MLQRCLFNLPSEAGRFPLKIYLFVNTFRVPNLDFKELTMSFLGQCCRNYQMRPSLKCKTDPPNLWCYIFEIYSPQTNVLRGFSTKYHYFGKTKLIMGLIIVSCKLGNIWIGLIFWTQKLLKWIYQSLNGKIRVSIAIP